MDEKPLEVKYNEPTNEARMPVILVRGTGRIIRKDGTVIPFTLEGSSHGSDSGNGDPQRNR